MQAKKIVKKAAKSVFYGTYKVPVIREYTYSVVLYRKYHHSQEARGFGAFLCENRNRLHLEPARHSKAQQFARLAAKVDICPVASNTFFYTVDCFKTVENVHNVLGNTTADYSTVVHGSLRQISDALSGANDEFGQEEQALITALRAYVDRCRQTPRVAQKYARQLDAIETLFERPAQSLFESLQRILFFNQFLWQTGHTLNGLGHLDWILEDLYRQELAAGTLTREAAAELLKEFFRVLHENYWFKSAALMGDTGQIVILGGRAADGQYRCNDLTYLFIEVSRELRLPDPKVLLRCTADMPEDLLAAAVDCIAIGIGAPLLSNDDAVIPAMLSCGFDEADVYDYGTAACWEPLVPGISCDANNVASLNFAEPLVRMMKTEAFVQAASLEELTALYEEQLRRYVKEVITPLTKYIFEEEPLLSLVSPSALERRKDITRGGAKYNNLGLTSVGMGAAVNSLLNADRLVFREKRCTLAQLAAFRKSNYAGQDALVQELKDLSPAYGSDAPQVVALTRRIMAAASAALDTYRTPLGGRFKVGLSSPAYITGARAVGATLDGRKNGEPLGVHISSAKALPTTELLSFAMQLDYRDNRLNGNVIDFITSPGMLTQNRQKYTALLRAGFAGGIFQLQMNVVDSKTLIAAKADPTLFPDLVVRVWGFSAYFNDLPEEYKDVLITRAMESEKAA